MDASSHILQSILSTAKQARQQSQKPMAVFDLDSTLYDVSPRIQIILHEFAQLPEVRRVFTAEELSRLKVDPSDWGIRAAVQRAGLDGAPVEVLQLARDFWRQRFFSNQYLEHDRVYPGAVEFVAELRLHEVQIVYLTGRDELRMGDGTRTWLANHGFPLDGTEARLVLKPRAGADDAVFKAEFFAQPTSHSPIWFFENEPANIHAVRALGKEIEIIFFDSTHSGKAHPPKDLPTIRHYLIEES